MNTTLFAATLVAGLAAGQTNLVVQRTADPTPAGGPAIEVRGIVTTPEGEPLANAAVVLRARLGGQQYAFGVLHNRDVLARTITDAEGRFRFDKIGVPPRMNEIIESLQRGGGAPS